MSQWAHSDFGTGRVLSLQTRPDGRGLFQGKINPDAWPNEVVAQPAYSGGKELFSSA